MSNKKQHGQYFTIHNPFKNKPFITWYELAMTNSKNNTILEPFAGANNLIKTLKKTRDFDSESYDIEPKDKDVQQRDTLKNFPKGFDIIITNPPYLAKNSAKRNGLNANFIFDDLYKDCLSVMLENVGYVAAIIPATFLHWSKMNERLYGYVMLTEKMFEDTETPVCLALFVPEDVSETQYYLNSKKLNIKKDILKYTSRDTSVRFNSPLTANLALIAFDSTKGDTIKFLPVSEIDLNKIKNTSRNIVCISVKNTKITNDVINSLNEKLRIYREKTFDIFMTPFKGVRKDMKFRRRIMFKQARAIIKEVIYGNE